MLGEAGNAAHGGRTEQDAANNFCDDTRLTYLLEQESEDACDDDDDGGLNDKESERVRGFELGGVSAANDAVAAGSAGNHEVRHVGGGDARWRVYAMCRRGHLRLPEAQ